jgi:hypothetical protein
MTIQTIVDWFPTSSEGKHSGQKFCDWGNIGFCADTERHIWCGHANLSTGTGRYYLQGEMHEWLTQVKPRYDKSVKIGKLWMPGHPQMFTSELRDRCAFTLVFSAPALAAMFKLRWFNAP